MRKKLIPLFLSVILLASLMGCAGVPTIPDPTKMTPKQFSAYAMATYNTQYEDYKLEVAKPNLTEEQKKILRQKKVILTTAYPLIQTFDLAVVEGKPIDLALQTRILDLISQLVTKGGK